MHALSFNVFLKFSGMKEDGVPITLTMWWKTRQLGAAPAQYASFGSKQVVMIPSVLVIMCHNMMIVLADEIGQWVGIGPQQKALRAGKSFMPRTLQILSQTNPYWVWFEWARSIQSRTFVVFTRSAGSHKSQFFDLLQFLGHQKIFYKTCICAVKVALNFVLIRKRSHCDIFGPALI